MRQESEFNLKTPMNATIEAGGALAFRFRSNLFLFLKDVFTMSNCLFTQSALYGNFSRVCICQTRLVILQIAYILYIL